MALLPQQIPPQSTSLGTVADKDGKIVGAVTMDVNWWLFLYNIAKQILSASGSPIPVTNVAVSIDLSNDDTVPPNPAPFTVIDWMGPV